MHRNNRNGRQSDNNWNNNGQGGNRRRSDNNRNNGHDRSYGRDSGGDWNDRNERRNQHRQDNRFQPYRNDRSSNNHRRSNQSYDSPQRPYGVNQRQNNYAYSMPNLAETPPLASFLPPPPMPPTFNGSSFNSQPSRSFDGDEDSEFNRALCLEPEQVPEYILRMRAMGLLAYPPALIDEHVRSQDTLPFFGESLENILHKKTFTKESLPAFRGYTNLVGDEVSDDFYQVMQKLAEIDHKECHLDALNRSGIEEFKTEVELKLEEEASALKRQIEVVRYEIPDHEAAESSEYLFAGETSTMKHDLGKFGDDIQPFENSHINKPTGFLSKLKSILKK